MTRPTDRRIEYLLSVDKRFGPLTRAQVAAALKFRDLARDRLGLHLHIGQLAFAGLVLARDRAHIHSAEFLTLLLASGNRAGKTALLAALIIYCCIDKTNKAKPITDAEIVRWLRSEYHWYHFGIAQEVADLVYADIVRILSGTHEGQGDRGCPITASGPIADWSKKEYGDYRWIVFAPEWGGAEVHFRTTGEKALGQLGKDMHGISFDEAGIERNLPYLIKEVFNLRRLGTGGQLLMVSTPSEDLGSDFADNWDFGDPKNPKHLVNWRSMRMSTRDNIGYGLDQTMFDRLIEDMDERTIRQNIEGEFLQAKAAYFNGENVDICFVVGVPERTPAKAKGIYLQGLDPAKSADSAWSVVLKVVRNPDDIDRPFLVGVRAEQKRGQKSTETLQALAADSSNAYNVARLGSVCYTALDATGFGGKMFREAIEADVPNLTNVEFGGSIQKKRMLLGDLRTVIDEGRLLLPKEGVWLIVRKQLLGYRLEDKKIEQDSVMALVCAVHLIRRTPIDGVEGVPMNASVSV
jgi:ribosomal protein L27